MAKKSLLSAEDKALFRQQVANLARHDISKIDLPANAHDTAKSVSNTSKNISSSNVDTTIAAESNLSYAKPGLQHKVLKQLKQGKLAIAAILDLHGLIIFEAKNALNRFIAQTRLTHSQCALIIHGKSAATPEGRTTIKQITASLLKQHPHVLAFASAKPKDGGAGALYVMLKQNQ